MVGDPSGKNAHVLHLAVKMYCAMRKPYKEQIYKILDPQKTKNRLQL